MTKISKCFFLPQTLYFTNHFFNALRQESFFVYDRKLPHELVERALGPVLHVPVRGRPLVSGIGAMRLGEVFRGTPLLGPNFFGWGETAEGLLDVFGCFRSRHSTGILKFKRRRKCGDMIFTDSSRSKFKKNKSSPA
jgi:hypothetical protein